MRKSGNFSFRNTWIGRLSWTIILVASWSVTSPAVCMANDLFKISEHDSMQTHQEIAFIDSNISEPEYIYQHLSQYMATYMLTPSNDGLKQMADILEISGVPVDAVHIVSHGAPGMLFIGNQRIDNLNIDIHARDLKRIGKKLNSGSDILLYGCRIGLGKNGGRFLRQLSRLTGADIAASNNYTGPETLNGDWRLEVAVGDIDTYQETTVDISRNYPYLLSTFTFSTATDNGADATETADSVILTVTSSGNDVGVYDWGAEGYDCTAEAVYTDNSVLSMTFDFNGDAVDITNLFAVDTWGFEYTWRFTPTPLGGGNTAKDVFISSNGATVDLNWSGVTSFTVEESTGQAIDPIIDTINFSVQSNAAPLITVGNLSYTEGQNSGNPVILDGSATASDADGDGDWDSGAGLTVQITANNESSDEISIDTSGSFSISAPNLSYSGTQIGTIAESSGTANDGTVTNNDTLTINFNSNATNASVQALVRSIAYRSTSDAPTAVNSTRTVTFTLTDVNSGSGNDTASVTITAQNDAPAISNLDGDSFSYSEGDGASALDQGTAVSIADVDSSDFNGGALTVTISAGEDAAEDVLSFSTSGAVSLADTTSGSNVSVSGTVVGTLGNTIAAGADLVVNLNSNATTSNMATLIAAATYENTDTDNPTAGVRTVDVSLSDGDGGTSSTAGITVTVSTSNDAPTLSNLDGDSFSYSEGDGASTLDQGTAVSVADVDSSDFNGGALTVTISAGEDAAEDVLSFSTSGAVSLAGTTSGSNVSVSGTVVGTLGNTIAAGADLVVNLNSNATASNMATLVAAATYENTDTDNPTAGARTVDVSLSDGDGGTSSTAGITVTVSASNDAPTLSSLDGDSFSYSEGDGASALDQGTAVSVADVDSSDFNGGVLTVTISAGEDAAEDVLSFSTSGAVSLAGTTSGSNVSVSGTVVGTLGNTIAAGADLVVNLNSNAAASNMAPLIAATTYENTDTGNPTTGARTVDFSLSDGDGGTSSTAGVTVTVSASNDAPAVAVNTGLTLNEGATAAITGSELNEGDPDDSGAGLTYTVTTTVANGTLWVDADDNGSINGAEAAISANDTFTQEDIDNGSVKYAHNGGETSSDSFIFSLADGGENGASAVTGQTFNITITAQNDAPTVATNTGLSLNEGATSAITSSELNEGDPDDSGAGLTYTVTTTVTNGTLWVDTDGSGTVNNAEAAISASDTFTQADIDNGYVKYTHDGGETTSDSFIFSLADGGESGASAVTGQTFAITITAQNDTPVITGQDNVYTYAAEPVTIVLNHLTVSDPDSTYPDDFSLTVYDGSNYSRSGATITPDGGFNGWLTVPVQVNDGGADSNTFNLSLYVATLISVTNTDDSGAGSLRQAVADASNGDTIDLSGLNGTITLTSGSLVVDKDLTIQGPADERLVISSDGNDRVMTVAGVSVTISDLTISGGLINDHGAGIHNTGDLALYRVTISDNTTTGSGNGAGIYNEGTLTAGNSTLSNNDAAGDGGAVFNSGTLTLNNCTIADNLTSSTSGGIENTSVLNISNSLVARNTSKDCRSSGSIGTNINNLIKDDTCSPTFSGDPGLGLLQDNGGNTDTHALLAGSIAIDAADNSTAENMDQRNVSRPADGDGDGTPVADIGAFEYRLGTVRFSTATYSISEAATLATITVRRSESCDGESSVKYATSNGTAVDSDDYTPADGTLNWNQGDNTDKTFTVAIVDDVVDENSETVNLTLYDVTGAKIDSPSTALLTIHDNDHTLTVEKAGIGTGTINSSPSGIDCGSTCSAVFADDAVITLSATAANAHSIFTGWSGGDCSGADECTITLNSETTITATFAFLDSDGDGIPDFNEGSGDTDNDGTPDNQDSDSDGDGIDDAVEGNVDTDNDGTPDFQDPEADGDGVGDAVENGAANDGDGNGDGIPDRLQNNVTTLMTYDETDYVTFESPSGTTLAEVQAMANPSPGDMPEGSNLAYGLYDFTINGVDPGESVQLILYLPEGARVDSYLKYGPTPDDETYHWYEFVYDGVTGAEIDGNVIVLHFVDGDEGDDDLTENGVIIDAGGPMVDTGGAPHPDGYGPIGNGCFVGGLTIDGGFNGLAAGVLAALICMAVLLRVRSGRQVLGVIGLTAVLIAGVPGTGQADEDTADGLAPFYLNAGVGFAWIDESIAADYQGQNYEMTVDNDIYPVFRFGYAYTDHLAFELGFRWDIYSGKMDRSNTGGSGSPKGYTFLLGPVYTFSEYQCKYLGPLKPMVHLNLGYTVFHDDLDYPVGKFDPALGVDLAVGVQRKNIDLRLGYRHFKLDGGGLQNGTTSAADSLDLSGVYMEIAWRFDFAFFGDIFAFSEI